MPKESLANAQNIFMRLFFPTTTAKYRVIDEITSFMHQYLYHGEYWIFFVILNWIRVFLSKCEYPSPRFLSHSLEELLLLFL